MPASRRFRRPPPIALTLAQPGARAATPVHNPGPQPQVHNLRSTMPAGVSLMVSGNAGLARRLPALPRSPFLRRSGQGRFLKAAKNAAEPLRSRNPGAGNPQVPGFEDTLERGDDGPFRCRAIARSHPQSAAYRLRRGALTLAHRASPSCPLTAGHIAASARHGRSAEASPVRRPCR